VPIHRAVPPLLLDTTSNGKAFVVRVDRLVVVSLHGPKSPFTDEDQWTEVTAKAIYGAEALEKVSSSRAKSGAVVTTFRAVSRGVDMISALSSSLPCAPGRPCTNLMVPWSVTVRVIGNRGNSESNPRDW